MRLTEGNQRWRVGDLGEARRELTLVQGAFPVETDSGQKALAKDNKKMRAGHGGVVGTLEAPWKRTETNSFFNGGNVCNYH